VYFVLVLFILDGETDHTVTARYTIGSTVVVHIGGSIQNFL